MSHQTSLLGNRFPDCRRRGDGGEDVRLGEDEERRHRHTYVRETERASGENQRERDRGGEGGGQGGHMISWWPS